jgi:adenylosuccinate synthase
MEQLALTKLDVLSGLPELRIAVAYERDGERFETLPFDELERVEPVYERLEGFSEDISGCQSRDELPAAARRYIARLEELVGCPVGVVSVGPDRRQTLGITDPFGAR